jgi:predicted XRE-type DNA-binding protein
MNERPDTERIKAQLAADILRVVAEQKLTDAEACARLGFTDHDLGQFRAARLEPYSIDRLIGFLTALDQRVELRVGRITGNPLRSIVERLAVRNAEIPADELAKLPTDLAANHDHYLYGTPKRY